MLLGGCALFLSPAKNALPVQIGGYSDDDACLAVGRPVQDAGQARTLEVRIRPDHRSPLSGTIGQDGFFWMCDTTADGAWTGILFTAQEDGRIACGVSGTIAQRHDYRGPCLQGWVPSNTITLYAG